MANTQFEIIDNKNIRIGDTVVSAFYHKPPLGNIVYSVESTSNHREKALQYLSVYNFQQITPVALPNGIAISISNPGSEFPYVVSADIVKADDKVKVTLVMDLLYRDWHLPFNLVHFVEQYEDKLRTTVTNFLGTQNIKMEASFIISCTVSVDTTKTILDAYNQLDRELQKIYRKCLSDITAPVHFEGSKAIPSDETGFKWWIKYVIVPIVGSGTFAGVLALLLGKL